MKPSTHSAIPCILRGLCHFCRRLLSVFLLFLLTARAGAAAEAVVRSNGADISDSATIDYQMVSVGSSSTKSFTFHNIGPDPMTGIRFTSSGSTNFTLNAPSGTFVLLPTQSISFSITFSPAQAFTSTGAVSIANSDPNENPYNLNLRGIGTAPEIDVIAGPSAINDGGTLNFGNVRVGISVTRQVTIQNDGNATLDQLNMTLSGNAYSVTPLGISSLAPGGSKTVIVTFTPQGTFQSTGTLRIFSSDANENPYDIQFTGTGVLPSLDAESPPGTPVFDNAGTLSLSGPVGQPAQQLFLLRNVSGSDITGITLSIDGPDAANFFAGPLPSDTLAPGATMTFPVIFTAPFTGTFEAALHVAQDQSPGNPFDIALSGTGTTLSDLGDEDLDGTANVLETATGSDPLTPGPPPGVIAMNGGNLELAFNRSVAALNAILLTVEWTENPAGTWTPLDNASATILSDDGVLQQIVYAMPAGTNGRRFMRIRATRL